jgi:glycosyltransferase involved in cell wall biosynthesis
MLRIGLLASPRILDNQRAVLENLSKLLGDEFELDLLTGAGASVPPGFKGQVFHTRLRRPDPYGLRYATSALVSYNRLRKPDLLINVSHPFPLGAAVAITGRMLGVPTVVRMTGDPFAERMIHDNPLVRARKWVVHEHLLPLMLRLADGIVSVGPAIADALLKRGVPAEKVRVLPQPFDAEIFVRNGLDKQAARRELGLSPDKRVVLYVGSLSHGKGTDRLAAIARIVQKQNSNLQFCVAGDGPMASELAGFAAEDLLWLGRVPRERMKYAFCAADVLLHPTRSDGLPNVVLEALTAGLPVVSTTVGEIPKYVSNIADDEQSLAELVTRDDLVCDVLPASFEWSAQRDAYRELLHYSANSRKKPKRQTNDE